MASPPNVSGRFLEADDIRVVFNGKPAVDGISLGVDRGKEAKALEKYGLPATIADVSKHQTNN